MNLLHALMFTMVVAMATGQSIKIRINQQAINLLAHLNVSKMEEGFEGMTFSNIIGNSSFYVIHETFNISNLILNGLKFREPTFILRSPNEVGVKTSRTNGTISGEYDILYTNTVTNNILLEYKGNFSADLNDGSNVIVIGMNEDDGTFRTTVSSCQSESSSLSIDGKNRKDGTYIVENILNNYLKAEIKEQMCLILIDGLVPKVNSLLKIAKSSISLMEQEFEETNLSNLLGNYTFFPILQLFNISNLVLHDLKFQNPILIRRSQSEILIKTKRSIVNITGNYYIHYLNGLTDETILGPYTGYFSGKMSGDYNITAQMNEDDGAFHTNASSCQSELSNINVDEKNNANGKTILENILNKIVKSEIIKQMCSALFDELDPKVNSFIEESELKIGIDLNLVGDPVVTEMNNANKSFVEAVLNGKFHPIFNPNIIYNFGREVLPEFSSSDASVRLMLGNYVLQTLLNAFYETGIFTQQIDLDDPLVINGFPFLLNAHLITAIAPNNDNLNFTGAKPLRVMLEATNSPTITINPTNIIVDGQFVVSVFVINDSRSNVTGADRNAIFAFSLSANASITANISITNNIIFPKLTSLNFTVSVLDAEPVGNNIYLLGVRFLLQLSKRKIVEAVNGLFAEGIKIPAAFRFGLTNLELELYDGYAEMSADVALVSN